MHREQLRIAVKRRLLNYIRLMRLNNPVGIWLLLWPVLWALWLAAEGVPRLLVLLVFVLGTVLMRSAGCVINDYADRDLDPNVERTKDRPLATRSIEAWEALVLFAVLSLTAFALVLLMSPIVILMSIPGVILAITYPWMKRLHSLPQAYLGLAFSWGILMAWVAQTDAWPTPTAWLLFGASVCLTLAYDTIYAMADSVYDERIGIKSSAVLFGRYDLVWVGFFQLSTIVLLLLVGTYANLGLWYCGGVVCALLLFAYQQWLLEGRDPVKCIAAFKNNAWVGFIIFAGLVLDYIDYT